MTRTNHILIAGGAGFIGSHLSERLLLAGNIIYCLDNFITGNMSNIAQLLHASGFHLIEQDVCSPIDINVDEIYNLACPASPIQYQQHPIETCKASILGTINLLELAKACNAKLLQASTSEVYGDPYVHPQTEEYWGNVNPIGIRSCYDEGKRCAESLCMDYYRIFGVKVKIARIFNTYGPRMSLDDGRVIPTFIKQAINNHNITVFGSGSQTRSFQYIDDLINGLLALMETNKDVTGPINLGNPEEITISDIAHKIISQLNSSSSISYLPAAMDDPMRRKPCIRMAKNILNWQPCVDIDSGLNLTIEYFKSIIHN